MIKAMCIVNFSYNGKQYRLGEVIDLTVDEYSDLLLNKLVRKYSPK